MTTRIAATSLLVALCSMSAQSQGTAYTERGVEIRVPRLTATEAGVLRLSAVADGIIRVEAAPGDTIPESRRSLIVVEQGAVPEFTVSEGRDWVSLLTAQLAVSVDKQTGRLAFVDRASGDTLLQESAVGGKAFSRYVSPQTELPDTYRPSSPDEIGWGRAADAGRLTLEERTGYTWRTLFDSPDSEAFYGLGQHQAEEMNYKGRDEELFQYNTKVSVPFVVSSRKYGLLWDTYSYCRWGNPSGYVQLGDAFALADGEGNPGALTGTYTDSHGAKLTRREDSLYFEHSGVVGNLPEGFRLDGASVVYEGTLTPRTTADHRFLLYYAGYVSVYVDDSLVVAERWRTAWNPNSYKFCVHMTEGRPCRLRVEWRPDGSTSYIGLRVAAPYGADEQQKLLFWSEMSPKMDYYFMAAATLDGVISHYRRLTGLAQVMPKWAMGFWQSRERYKTADELLSTLAEFRRRRIPVDNIVQDWNYWEDDQWGSHHFDLSRYPDPQAMLDSVHAMHGRYMISVWPKFYCNTDNYRALDANGWMYRQAVSDSIRDWVGPGYVGSFYDAYSAGARKMFWQQMDDNLYSALGRGIDAWWMDASEPNVRDCTPIDYRKALCGPTALGTSDEYFNAYSIVNADAIYNGQRSVEPDKRVFLLTRSGFAGLQRYGTATWSGDIGTRWEDMRAQMTAGINFSMAGIPFWGMDIGGFCVERRYVNAQKEWDKTGRENADLDEWRELQARWHQFGCFVPLYRTHGQWPAREVWNIAPEGHPAYETIVAYHRLRYRLMPYLYSMAGWVWLNDYTIMRGLAMDYGDDEAVLSIGDQWMFGPSLMACPVTAYKARNREVYLPRQCGWYDLHTGRRYDGGQTLTVDAPYDRIPLFAPEGAIIPLGSDMQWSDERPADTITLYVCAGADGSFVLYEDDGLSYGYERGEYATIQIDYSDADRRLTIRRRQGSFPGMLRRRTFRVVWMAEDSRKPFDVCGSDAPTIDYDGREVSIAI